METCIYLGNLNSKRDWGHAKDYVEGMWLMLQQNIAEDYVLATGITTTIRDFVKMAFQKIGVNIEFNGNKLDEIGYVKSFVGNHKLTIGQEVIKIDPRYFRPAEVDLLVGDASKAMKKLNWQPKYSLNYLIEEMVGHDLEILKNNSKFNLNLKNK
jgi:GDPmannose 4,6-dehydratase